MALFNKGDNQVEMSCRSNKKTGEVVCHGKRGEKPATVYGKMGEDGYFRIKDFDGDMDLVREIEDEMLERTKQIKTSAGLSND